MSRKTLLQYLELLSLSGIQDIYLSESKMKKMESNNDEQIETNQSIEVLREKYKNCRKCRLSEGRTHFVYGNGDPKADLMIIGEGPGQEEDKTGNVFVGRAGQLLTKMLKAIDIEREDVYIANVVKCRPPNNRDPQKDEEEACLPYLIEQIEIIQPKIILLLGRVAAIALFHLKQSLGDYRGKVFYFQGIKTYVTYHPSALLRNQKWKKPAWVDLQKVRDEYNLLKDN